MRSLFFFFQTSTNVSFGRDRIFSSHLFPSDRIECVWPFSFIRYKTESVLQDWKDCVSPSSPPLSPHPRSGQECVSPFVLKTLNSKGVSPFFFPFFFQTGQECVSPFVLKKLNHSKGVSPFFSSFFPDWARVCLSLCPKKAKF